MKDVKDVDVKKLREAIAALNGANILEEKLVVKGKTTDDMMDELVRAVETLDDTQASELPEKVILMYNNLIEDEIPEDTAEAEGGEPEEKEITPEDEKVEEEVEKEPEKEEERTESVKDKKAVPKVGGFGIKGKKDKWGQGDKSRCGRANTLLAKGATLEQITQLVAKEFGDDDKKKIMNYLRGHIRDQKNRGFKISEIEGVFKYEE